VILVVAWFPPMFSSFYFFFAVMLCAADLVVVVLSYVLVFRMANNDTSKARKLSEMGEDHVKRNSKLVSRAGSKDSGGQGVEF